MQSKLSEIPVQFRVQRLHTRRRSLWCDAAHTAGPDDRPALCTVSPSPGHRHTSPSLYLLLGSLIRSGNDVISDQLFCTLLLTDNQTTQVKFKNV